MESNEKEDVCYPQPTTTEQRLRIANDFYTGWPERFYIVDEEGVIVYKGKPGPFGYHPEEVEAWLAKRFPNG
jgi:peroxiredoxin